MAYGIGAVAKTTSYIIPIGDLSLEGRAAMRMNVDQKLTALAGKLAIRPSEDDLVIRETLPNFDLGLTDVAAAITNSWLIPGAGVVGTNLQYFAPVIAQDHAVGVYGIGNESTPGSISVVQLTQGPASAQARGQYQIEDLYLELVPKGYLSEAITFSRGEVMRVMVLPRLAFAVFTERLHLLSRTIEPVGFIISAPSV